MKTANLHQGGSKLLFSKKFLLRWDTHQSLTPGAIASTWIKSGTIHESRSKQLCSTIRAHHHDQSIYFHHLITQPLRNTYQPHQQYDIVVVDPIHNNNIQDNEEILIMKNELLCNHSDEEKPLEIPSHAFSTIIKDEHSLESINHAVLNQSAILGTAYDHTRVLHQLYVQHFPRNDDLELNTSTPSIGAPSTTVKYEIPQHILFYYGKSAHKLSDWTRVVRGAHRNMNELNFLKDLLLNIIFVFPEKREQALEKLRSHHSSRVPTNKLSQSCPITIEDLTAFYDTFKIFNSTESEREVIRNFRIDCKTLFMFVFMQPQFKHLGAIREIYESVKEEEGIDPPQKIVNQMMSSITNLSASNSPEKNFHIEEIKKIYSQIPTPNTKIQHSLLHGYAKFGMLKEMEELFEKIEVKNAYTFSILLYGYCIARKFTKALSVFSRISKPVPEHLRLVIALFLQVGLDVQAEDLLQSLPNSAHKIRLTNELMDVYNNANDLNSVHRIFTSMEQRDCYSVGIAINAKLKQRLLNDALEIFDKYCKNGPVECNSVIYNSILYGITKYADIHKSLSFFHKIPSQLKNDKTYSIIMSALVSAKAYVHAQRLYYQFPQFQSMHSHAIMIKCYTVLGKFEQAEQIFQSVKKPDVTLCNNMMDAYVKMGKLLQAHKVFNKIYKKDIASYNILLRGYVEYGKIERAEYIFDRIPEPDSHTFVTLLHGYTENGHFTKVETFYAAIPRQYKNEHVYTCMMKFYTKRGMIRRVEYFYRKISNPNFVADSSMMCAYLQCNAFNSMRHFFENVISKRYVKKDSKQRFFLNLMEKMKLEEQYFMATNHQNKLQNK
ncbi:hypothetical protein C9374_000708 [Naegleria lovaniensis]|uniref:Uncharacterized protein n=1 Tax=Naegleria lovaniensis TaxID=51637 RepID=A0AA88GYX5_NAELO|nr:uncharacterized protein C9374_000708 [Naegleria lovaniensis]KAG2388544.1 hypothetical protein C9374_000708 [Naegleria lovaniensis]